MKTVRFIRDDIKQKRFGVGHGTGERGKGNL